MKEGLIRKLIGREKERGSPLLVKRSREKEG